MRMKSTLSVAALAALALLVVERPVEAYLDPGSGSMLLQVLLGGFAAIGVATKLYWHRLAERFRRRTDARDGRER